MRARVSIAATWCTCLTVGAYLRLSSLPHILVGDEVASLGPDTSFHAWRMLQTWQRFPHVPARDPLLDWPHGAVAPWPQGFDFLGALLAWPLHDRHSALVAFAALPVLLGLLVMAATAFTVRVLLPQSTWWMRCSAAFIVGVVPQAVSVARFGNPDHHVAEQLAMTALGTWALWTTRMLEDGPLTPGSRMRIEVALGAISFGALALFVGSSAYVAIAILSVAFASFSAASRDRLAFGIGAPGLMVGALLAALLYSPLVEAHGLRFDYAFPSFLQPLLLVVAAVGCIAVSGLGVIVSGSSRQRLLGAVAFVAVAAVALLVLARLEATAALRHGLHEWFGGGQPLLTNTSESVPLLGRGRLWEASTWARVHRYYGLLGLLGPLCFALAAIACVRWLGLRKSLPFFVWTFCIVVMAAYQNRFGRVALVNLAVSVSIATAFVAERAGRTANLVRALPALAFLADPAFHHYLALTRASHLPAEQEAGAYLRAHTPAVKHGARSGVLTGWDQSHHIVRFGERPVTAAGFGFYVGGRTYFEVEELWRGDEAGLLKFMDRRDLGFVVQGASGYASTVLHGRGAFLHAPDGSAALNAPYLRRLPLSPLIFGGTGFPAFGVRHLTQLLPIHASHDVVSPQMPLPTLWVYARVPGARVVGHAQPNALVSVHTALQVRGVELQHDAWAQADATGAFDLTTPLPTAYRSGGIETAAHAELLVNGKPTRRLEVSEQAVRAGETITLPPP